MRVCVLGVGRSGTTWLYVLLQELMGNALDSGVDHVYEPFLWDRATFDGPYRSVSKNFRSMDSVSIEAIYRHLRIPLFASVTDDSADGEWLRGILTPNAPKEHLLIKMIRACGRLPLLHRNAPDARFVLIVRSTSASARSVRLRRNQCSAAA